MKYTTKWADLTTICFSNIRLWATFIHHHKGMVKVKHYFFQLCFHAETKLKHLPTCTWKRILSLQQFSAPEPTIWKRLVRNGDRNKFFSCIFNVNGYQRFTNTKDLCAETPTIYINLMQQLNHFSTMYCTVVPLLSGISATEEVLVTRNSR